MPTKKIAELPKSCRHIEHQPPKMRVFSPGVYEHECPQCHVKTVFTVSRSILVI